MYFRYVSLTLVPLVFAVESAVAQPRPQPATEAQVAALQQQTAQLKQELDEIKTMIRTGSSQPQCTPQCTQLKQELDEIKAMIRAGASQSQLGQVKQELDEIKTTIKQNADAVTIMLNLIGNWGIEPLTKTINKMNDALLAGQQTLIAGQQQILGGEQQLSGNLSKLAQDAHDMQRRLYVTCLLVVAMEQSSPGRAGYTWDACTAKFWTNNDWPNFDLPFGNR
jgi:hypothetical protein